MRIIGTVGLVFKYFLAILSAGLNFDFWRLDFVSAVALRRSKQTWESLQDRAMRCGTKDVDKKSNFNPADSMSSLGIKIFLARAADLFT